MKKEYKKYLRPAIAVIAIILGVTFMLIPFIPLGYIFIFIALYLLLPYFPPLKKLYNKLKKKDKSNKLEKAEDKVNDLLDEEDKK